MILHVCYILFLIFFIMGLILFSGLLILVDCLPKPEPAITITKPVTPKKKKTVTKKQKTTPKPKVQFANSWEDDIILDAVDKLVKMGHKRSRSRMIVSRLCSSKSYERTEDIILDAMKKCV